MANWDALLGAVDSTKPDPTVLNAVKKLFTDTGLADPSWVAYSILAKTRFSHQLAPFGAKMGAFDAELPQESEKGVKTDQKHKNDNNKIAKMCRISVSRIL